MKFTSVERAIAAADSILPGEKAPDGNIDPRWQAIIAVGEFVESEPEDVWTFVLRWAASPDSNLRDAVATCLLEHLVEHRFDQFIERIEHHAQTDALFADTVSRCWQFGQAAESMRAARWKRLLESIRATG